MFIKLEGIDGESEDDKHKKWVDVLNFSYATSQPSSNQFGGGGGTGRANFSDFSFSHYVDRASPNLFLYCAQGKHIDKVVFHCCKTDKGTEEFLTVTMQDVMVTHVSPAGGNGETLIMESVGLSPAIIEFQYKQQKKDGSFDAAVTRGWDIKANKQS
jgi:type VI secretion system secreted protein Hcp